MKIEWHNEKRRIRDLIPYVANPRQITDKQAKDLKASLDKFGIADPIVINTDNTIIGGHQRKKILESLMGVDPDFEIDVRVPDRELTIDEARELNVRLNKNMGQWDFDVLANNFELDDLLEWGFERTDLDLDLWMDDPPDDAEPQIDRAEELREIWGVESGQLWQLGEHRLICGDCTEKAVVERVMGGEKADMVFTNPPYGMNLNTDYTQMPECKIISNTYPEVIGDTVNFDPRPFLELFADIKEQFWWGGDYYYNFLPAGGSWIVWDKRNEGSDGLVGNHFEVCWSKQKHRREMKRFIWSGFTARERDSERVHPTQKPVDLCVSIIEPINAQVIIDTYLGSGTTLIACERLNRKCRAVEISPAYVAVAIQRWVDVTGGVPKLLE